MMETHLTNRNINFTWYLLNGLLYSQGNIISFWSHKYEFDVIEKLSKNFKYFGGYFWIKSTLMERDRLSYKLKYG